MNEHKYSRRNWARHSLREISNYLRWRDAIDEDGDRAIHLWAMTHSGPRAAESLQATINLCHLLDVESPDPFEVANIAMTIENLKGMTAVAWPECDGTHSMAFVEGHEFCPICVTMQDICIEFYAQVDWVEEHGLVLMAHVEVDEFIQDVGEWLEETDHPGGPMIEFQMGETEDGWLVVQLESIPEDRVYELIDDSNCGYDYGS